MCLFFLLPIPGLAQISWETCLPSVFAHRMGQPRCWTRFNLTETELLCFDQRVWNQWLRAGGQRCARWSGRWGGYTNLKNVHFQPKRFFRVFYIEGFIPGGDRFGGTILASLELWRERVSLWLRQTGGAGISSRLVLDERTPGAPHGLLRKTGFVHLLTATGIHLYALASGVFYVALRITIGLRIEARWGLRLAYAFAWLVFLYAWVLSGGRFGMLRPWLIMSLRWVSRWLGFRWQIWSPLLVALGLDQLIAWCAELNESTQAGRLHYALAVGGGLAAIEWMRRRKYSTLREHIGLSVGSWLFTAPADMLVGNYAAVATPVLSFVTIPLYTLLVYPALIMTSVITVVDPGGALYCRWIWQTVDAAVMVLAGWVADTGGVTFISSWGSYCGAVLALVHLCWRRGRAAILGLALAFRLSGPSLRPTQVEQLDVGQGDAALVSNSEGTGLIDLGSERVMGAGRWLDILLARGLHHVNWIILTHLDEDHRGGLAGLLKVASVDCVETSSAQIVSERGRSLKQKLEHWDIPLRSRCRHPGVTRLEPLDPVNRPNGGMSGVIVPLENGHYVSLGDANRRTEIRWSLRLKKPVKILKLSHHGSRYSSSSRFLRRVSAAEAWISSGAGNRYGHPGVEVLNRLKGAVVRRTDARGFISVR